MTDGLRAGVVLVPAMLGWAYLVILEEIKTGLCINTTQTEL
jgi:hypothetical protein